RKAHGEMQDAEANRALSAPFSVYSSVPPCLRGEETFTPSFRVFAPSHVARRGSRVRAQRTLLVRRQEWPRLGAAGARPEDERLRQRPPIGSDLEHARRAPIEAARIVIVGGLADPRGRLQQIRLGQ